MALTIKVSLDYGTGIWVKRCVLLMLQFQYRSHYIAVIWLILKIIF